MDGEITLGEYDLYADMDSGAVYQSERTGKTLQISAQWESVDACLCSLFREEK